MRIHRCLLLLVAILSSSVPVHADLVTFDSLGAFTAAAPGLPVETFESGLVDPGGITPCPGPLSSAAASACFPAGGLLPGVVYSAVVSGVLTDDPLSVMGAGFSPFGNPSKALGPFAPDETTLNLAFTDVNAVGFDLQFFSLYFANISVFSPNQVLLGTIALPFDFAGGTRFAGAVSTTDSIGSVHVQVRAALGPGGSPGREIIDNVRFGKVPEPSSMLLLVAGLALVFRLRRA